MALENLSKNVLGRLSVVPSEAQQAWLKLRPRPWPDLARLPAPCQVTNKYSGVSRCSTHVTSDLGRRMAIVVVGKEAQPRVPSLAELASVGERWLPHEKVPARIQCGGHGSLG